MRKRNHIIPLHLNKKDHARALKERQENRALVHFSPSDKKIAADYDGMVSAASRAIMLTDRDNAPWSIIDAADPNFRNLSVVKAIIAGIERTIAAHDARAARLKVLESVPEVEEDARESLVSTLDAIDLSSVQAPEHYQKELKRLQKEIYQLSFRAYKKGISSTLIFEGWDAAGKGGAIRRLTAGTDARITRVIPISAPSDEELAHHYLWRFWRHIPRAGFITIYDRSWYGRVLVERVEKLTPKEDWARAYAEINHFEHQLTNNGNILLKFWLHISPEEQLRRFREREAIPWKRYKITDEDWRNRDKWPEYARAADEIIPGSARVLAGSNNTLALAYMARIKKKSYALAPLPVLREGAAYNSERLEEIASAAAIRRALRDGRTEEAFASMPEASARIFKRALADGRLCLDYENWRRLLRALLLRARPEELRGFAEISEGIEYKLRDEALSARSFEEWLDRCTSKRYPAGRLRRAAVHTALGIIPPDLEKLVAYSAFIGRAHKGEHSPTAVFIAAMQTIALPLVHNHRNRCAGAAVWLDSGRRLSCGASGHIYAIGRYPVGVVDLAGDGDDVRRIVSIGKSDYEFIGVLLADLSRRDKQFQKGIGRTKIR